MNKLKKRWGVTSNTQMFIIFLVFSINGSLSVFLAKPLLQFSGINQTELNPFVFWSLRIIIVFVLYQILLVLIGSLFGQYKFFWAFEKKMLSRLGFKKFIDK